MDLAELKKIRESKILEHKRKKKGLLSKNKDAKKTS